MNLGVFLLLWHAPLICACVLDAPACGCSLVPRELESGAVGGAPTEVRLVDKQNEEYIAPAYVAYGGEGQTMG